MPPGVTRRAVLGSLVTGSAAVAAGSVPMARAQVDGTWPMFARDGANTGHAPEVTGPTADVGGAWRTETGRGVSSSPAVVDGTVYVGSDDRHLYALAASDGSENWRFETGDRVTSSPAVVDGTVYVGGNDGSVYAVDATDGTEEWAFETDGPVVSSPTVVDGTVYIGSRDDQVYALDAADGSERWSFRTANDVSATPAVVDGTVYIGSGDWVLYALDAEEGEEEWRFEANSEIIAGAAVSAERGTAYVGSLDGNVYAVDIAAGDEQWRFSTGGAVVSSPAIDGDTVYVGSRGGSVYALATGGGDELWSFDTGRQVIGSPSVAGGVVYVGSQNRAVFGLLGTDGSRLWRFETRQTVTAAPAVLQGTVFVGDGTGSVYALQEGDRLPTAPTPTVSGSDNGGSSILKPLLLPATVVGFVAVFLGSAYAAKRAGLFQPFESATPEPSSGDEPGPDDDAPADQATAPAGADSAETTGEESPTMDLSGDGLPIWDVIVDDVISRAEESTRTATQDLLVTKYVDSDTLDAPMVAYEIESFRSEPAVVRLTEPIGDQAAGEEEIGQLPHGGEGWSVQDGTLVYERTIGPEGTGRTILARRDRSPDEMDALLAQPSVSVRE